LVGCTDSSVLVKVKGRGSFQNSSGLKEFGKQMIQRGYRSFVIDLGQCELMDSTFMGTLAGLALRLREMGHGKLSVVNASERNWDLLSNLGLDRLMEVADPGAAPAASDENLAPAEGESSSQAHKENVLTAHQALVEADPQNAVRFKDVLDYLTQELKQENRAEEI